MDIFNGYANGFIERKQGGRYEGRLTIDGVDISPIEGMYFEQNGKRYLWIKRKPLLEYDIETQSYIQRPREPRWETYLASQISKTMAFRGECMFLRFKYDIVGVWDSVLGKERQRLNLFVERLPMAQQSIINSINNRNKERKL